MCSPYTFSWTSRLRPSVPPELNPTGRNLHEQSLYIRVQALSRTVGGRQEHRLDTIWRTWAWGDENQGSFDDFEEK